MASLLLKKKDSEKDILQKFIDKFFGWLFAGFNKVFGRMQNIYAVGVCKFITRRFVVMSILFVALLFATAGSFKLVPSGFVPAQDKQYLVSFAQLPAGATLERTEEVMRAMGDIAMQQEGVVGAVQFPGLSINGFMNSASAGIVFVTLDAFDKRTAPHLSAFAIADSLQQKFMAIDDAFIAIFLRHP